MHLFRVWAPLASEVSVRIEAETYPMSQAGEGWWETRVGNAHPGMTYAFSVDGSDPVPDPASRWQPHGVHGPSRLLDNKFPWTDAMWNPPPLASGVIYELHIGTFTEEGTFVATIEKLDHLTDLGVTHVEFMPVAEFSGRWGWGYDGVDLYAPNHHYGSPQDLMKLVDACHARGLAVILDVVYNHFGPAGNYLGKFGPYTGSKYETPWGKAVNLDGPRSDEVRSFFIENAVMWLRDYHFDGLRLDAVHALIDNGAYHFLEQLADRIEDLEAELGRHLVLIAESDLNDPRVIRPCEIGGYGIDAQWSDDFHHALHTTLTGERSGYYTDFGALAQLAKALRQAYVYDGCFSGHRGRSHGRMPQAANGRQFVVSTQNHDQVGNRARGERLSHLAGIGKAKIAAALLVTSPFLPMLFQGEEWAASAPFLYFTQHEDEELGRAVSEGRKKEFSAFGWAPDDVPDPQDESTFQTSKLNWKEVAQPPHAGMLEWYRSLLRLRHATPALKTGHLRDVDITFSEDESWLLMSRGEITVACNFSGEPRLVPATRGEVILASSSSLKPDLEGLLLPPESVAILSTARNSEQEKADASATTQGMCPISS
ncbi:MAG: malto-oligosyltrehalose trehalohydrolase [Acidobacteriaceae bacterium]|nr:malto-oligosyltrehalose trehalohydrolase [Acidobacteriaceae bacterium]